MRCRILHESPHRLRVHLAGPAMTARQADILEAYLIQTEGVTEADVSERTQNAVIRFSGSAQTVKEALAVFCYEENEDLYSEHSSRAIRREYEDRLVFHVLKRAGQRLLLPVGLRQVVTAVKSVRYILPGIRSLTCGKLEVSVLDAITVSVSILRGNYTTASDIMFLLGISEILEEWTHKKAVDDLARSMALKIDKVWVKSDGCEIAVPICDIHADDLIVVRAGSVIPLDGTVEEGEASVNQASLTGESVPVYKKEGAYVYAGTVIEEGECVIRVKAAAGSGRYDSIVKMIEESEKLSSESENRAALLADRLVPWCLGTTALTWLITRNTNRALAVLMVDFSCALKLSIPLAVLSAMREASEYEISVKGGKYLEIVSSANTVVFDKTGTLTCSVPAVKQVIPFGGNDEREMLRLAACLEEHFPHSIASAVVEEASRQNLVHEEKHSQVQYVVAHGIASHIDGRKVVIGSYHFVFEDEKCTIPEGEQEKFDSIPEEYSHLYMAIGTTLAAVICIEDPIRPEAAQVVESLHALGIDRIVMMTGDSEKTARSVAKQVGVDAYYAEVLPEEKAGYIDQEHEKGRVVIMIGDGINDTPALSKADVAVAISNGAAVAREIADITLPGESLASLVTMRRLSNELVRRFRTDFRFILGFNSILILSGIAGLLQPAVTAYAHNFSTMAIGLYSMTNYLKKDE